MPHTGGGPLPSPIDYDHHFTARFTMTPAGHCFPLGGVIITVVDSTIVKGTRGVVGSLSGCLFLPQHAKCPGGGQLAHFGDASALPRNARKSKRGGVGSLR